LPRRTTSISAPPIVTNASLAIPPDSRFAAFFLGRYPGSIAAESQAGAVATRSALR
jgi:hypothetical protein